MNGSTHIREETIPKKVRKRSRMISLSRRTDDIFRTNNSTPLSLMVSHYRITLIHGVEVCLIGARVMRQLYHGGLINTVRHVIKID